MVELHLELLLLELHLIASLRGDRRIVDHRLELLDLRLELANAVAEKVPLAATLSIRRTDSSLVSVLHTWKAWNQLQRRKKCGRGRRLGIGHAYLVAAEAPALHLDSELLALLALRILGRLPDLLQFPIDVLVHACACRFVDD